MRAVLAIVLALAAAGCHGSSHTGSKLLTAVKVRAIERSEGQATGRYSATISPASRVDLAFKVGGYVDSIARTPGTDGKERLVQEGDRVTRGLELAGVRKSDYASKLSEARAGLGEAVAAREQAQLDFDRATKLAGTNSIPKADMDAARVRYDAAMARADGARARVEEARQMLGDTSLRAPMDGVLLQRSIELGSLAAPGTVAFSVADTESMKVAFGVPDTVRELLELGSEQTISSEAFPGVTFRGRITRVASVADPKSRVFEVEITIPNPDHELKAGMVASLVLSESKAEAPVAVLPLSAIVRAPGHVNDDKFAVFTLDDKTAPPTVHRKEVELGEFLGNVIAVKSGLSPGQKVVVQGASLLSDGEAVSVIP